MTVRPTYLDCCAILNVYATGRFAEILAASRGQDGRFAIGERVQREALWVGEEGARETVDLSEPVSSGMLSVERMETESELAMFVELAATLDDGEAETAALAYHRGIGVVTDDGVAIRVLGELKPAVPVLRTSVLMKRWAEGGGCGAALPVEDVRRALRDIQTRARFLPSKADPLREWWERIAA